MKTSELTGPALAWAVAKALGWNIDTLDDTEGPWIEGESFTGDLSGFTPSTDWGQGGPIIEREGMTIGKVVNSRNEWSAESFQDDGVRVKYLRYGPTALVAAMRCFVASHLGDEVEVPEELL